MSSKQIRSGAKAPGHRRHIVGRLMGYIKRGYKARFIIVLVCILVSAIANVAGSLFLGSLIDDYITPLLGAADPDFSGLVRALVMMGCLFLVGALCAYAYNRNMIVVSQGVQKTIRDDLFGHMQTLPIKYFDTHAHGDVMSVYTNDVDTLRQMFAQSIPQVINSSMTILVTFLGMLFTNALLTVVVLVCVCFALVVTRFLAGRSGRYFIQQQVKLGDLNGYIEEMINGQKVVKVFCHEQEAQDGFDRVNDEMFHSADKAHTYASILMPIMVNIGNVQYVIVAMVGGALALSGVDTTITLGVIASFLQLSKSFSNPINQISQQFNSIIMALAGAERIFALMDEEPEEDHGTVTLVNVSYDKEGHQLEESEKRTNLWAWKVPHSTDMVMVPVQKEADGSYTELESPAPGQDESWAWKYQEDGQTFYRPMSHQYRRCCQKQQSPLSGSDSFSQQITAHYRRHNASSKAQQQTYHPGRVSPHQAGDPTAQPRSADPSHSCGRQRHPHRNTASSNKKAGRRPFAASRFCSNMLTLSLRSKYTPAARSVPGPTAAGRRRRSPPPKNAGAFCRTRRSPRSAWARRSPVPW